MPAHHDVAVIGRGRLIERTCGFGTPVGQNRLMVRARQADAADVMTVAVLGIRAAKHQPILNAAQLRGGGFHYIVAKESRSLRCVGGSRGSRRRVRCPGVATFRLADHPIVHRRDRRPAALHAQLGGVTRHAVLFVPFPWGRNNLRHSNLPHTPTSVMRTTRNR